MTNREKGIPLEKQIDSRVIMGRAVSTVAMAVAALWPSGRVPAVVAQEPEEGRYGPEIQTTWNVEPAEDGEFQEPPGRYQGGDGKEYRLDYWEILTIPGQDASRYLEWKMVYTGVKRAERILGSVSLEENVSGGQAEGTLFLRKSRIVRGGRKDGLTALATFHAYGVDEYHGGSLVIPGDAVLEACVFMGGKLLEFTGLSLTEYRTLHADWSEEPYEDEEGRMCRQIMVRGRKLLRDYEAAHEGGASWTQSEIHALEVVYKQVPPTAPVFSEAVQKAGHVPVPEVQDEDREGNLWH